MDNVKELLKSVPSFHLCSAFEEEMGFCDFKRTPLGPEDWERRRRDKLAKGRLELLTYDEYVEQKKRVSISTDYALYAMRMGDAKSCVPIVSDYHTHLTPDFDGLFADMVLRAERAWKLAGLKLDAGYSPIVAQFSGKASGRVRINPTHFVYHDARDTVAMGYVVPWEHYEWVMNPFLPKDRPLQKLAS